jgi:hypothetical protein
VVQIHSPRPFISLESNSCTHFQNWLGFDFPSIRSNSDIVRRKLKARTNSFSNFFADRHIMSNLIVKVPRHARRVIVTGISRYAGCR